MYTYVYIYIYIYIYIYVYIYTYTYIYIHTHIYIYIHILSKHNIYIYIAYLILYDTHILYLPEIFVLACCIILWVLWPHRPQVKALWRRQGLLRSHPWLGWFGVPGTPTKWTPPYCISKCCLDLLWCLSLKRATNHAGCTCLTLSLSC